MLLHIAFVLPLLLWLPVLLLLLELARRRAAICSCGHRVTFAVMGASCSRGIG